MDQQRSYRRLNEVGLGKILASLVMLMGYGILAVPTGIVSVEIGRASKLALPLTACVRCGETMHLPQTRYCLRCGERLAAAELSSAEPKPQNPLS